MKITRRYALPLLLLPCMVGAAFLWPVHGPPAGEAPAPAAETDNVLAEPITANTDTARGQLDSRRIIGSVAAADPKPAAPEAPLAGSVQNSRGDSKEAGRIITKDGHTYPVRQYKALLAPNDPSANQWWVAPNGMSQVWDIPFGARKTTIAIIDGGFALGHQEFDGRWILNSGEIPGNGIDEDGNGFIDDVRGWDFAANDANVQAGENNPDGSGSTHGTLVAGVAAATGNNSVGVAGVNWYSSILPIQALDDDGIGDSFTVANSIYYAADRGADVINLSLGTEQTDPYMRQAVQYAIGKGSVVVAAAGNDGCDCIAYPANYPEVIAVGASEPSGAIAGFSSFGSNLDIIAPGQNMASPTWIKTNATTAYSSSVAGTSFAAPFVSGLLGLARNYQPDATWAEITGAMFERADRKTLTAAQPRNNQLGYGFTRANTMLDRLRTPQTSVMRYSFSPLMGDSSRVYQCENSIPATPLYELSSATQIRYTTSPISRDTGVQQGMTSRDAGYFCMGLPTDRPGILRVINLPYEIHNRFIKQ